MTEENFSETNNPGETKKKVSKADKPSAETKEKESSIVRFLRLRPKLRTPALLLLIVSIAVLSVVLGYVCLVWLLPIVWNWGFSPTTWRGILSFFGAIYLVIIPFVPVGFGFSFAGSIFELYVEDQEDMVRQKFAQLRGPQGGIESELEKNDKTGLIPLIRYSRLQLEAYYSIGLSQTQRSFRYSIIAMWIGFVIIVGGIVLKLMPTTTPNAGELHVITMASGALIEMISALFLWVYRSSITQLNYFYNQQMILHSILLCDRLSDAMTERDPMKKLIIESVLNHTWASAHQSLPLITRQKAPQQLPEA